MLAKDTICAEMAMMLAERNDGASTIDYPVGGTGAIVAALVRAILRLGGRVILGAHVDEVLVEGLPDAMSCWFQSRRPCKAECPMLGWPPVLERCRSCGDAHSPKLWHLQVPPSGHGAGIVQNPLLNVFLAA